MVLLEFSLYPTDKGASVSRYVARSLEIIDASGLPYRLGPMGTTLEGEYGQVMDVVRLCFERMAQDCDRVACQIKLDYRRGRTVGLAAKVDRLKEITGRALAS